VANEVTTTITMTYEDAFEADASVGKENFQRSVSTKRPFKNVQAIGTSEEAITLGDGGTFKELYLRNLDETNYVEIKVATGGAIFCKLLPGEDTLVRLGSGAQAPYAIANTAAVNLLVMAVPV
jgi:hypothetical protein